MAAIDSFGDRWERMAPREQLLMGALAVTLVICIVAGIGYVIGNGLERIRAKNDATRSALRALQTHRVNKAKRKNSGPEVKVPDEPLVLRSYLDNIVTQVGVVSPAYPTAKETIRGEIVEVSSGKITVRGLSLEKLQNFLQRIETTREMVAITDMQVRRDFRDKEMLDVDIDVSTFAKAPSKEEDEESKEGEE